MRRGIPHYMFSAESIESAMKGRDPPANEGEKRLIDFKKSKPKGEL